jgi:hypothetical protein
MSSVGAFAVKEFDTIVAEAAWRKTRDDVT